MGTGKYKPTGLEDFLKNDSLKEHREFCKIADISEYADNQLHMTAVADSDKSYNVGEIGFYTNTGVLFAVLSTTDIEPLAIKTKNEELLLAFDLVLQEIPLELIKLEHKGTRLNLAMTEEIAKLAGMIVEQNKTILSLQDRIIKLEQMVK